MREAGHALDGPPPASARRATDVDVEICRHALDRVPLSLIVDDSTALLNLNYFFLRDRNAHTGEQRRWDDLPVVIPERFTREWAEWCGENGVRGKFSVVPCPAAVGRIDRGLPLFGAAQLASWLRMCRECIVPFFDITPEMLTHTFIVDPDTLRPLPSGGWEQWEWQAFGPEDRVGEYMAVACEILSRVGLPPQGVTSPGGFGGQALPLYARLVGEHCRAATGRPAPFFFQRAVTDSPVVDTPVWYPDPVAGTAVGEAIVCSSDWTGSWTGYGRADPDRFITEDLAGGRLPEVIDAGSPCILLAHWQGMYGLHDGDRRGFHALRAVVERLRQRDPHGERTRWRKVSEITDYACARALATVQLEPGAAELDIPLPVPELTLRLRGCVAREVRVDGQPLTGLAHRRGLRAGAFCPDGPAGGGGPDTLVALDPRHRRVRVEWNSLGGE